jgi:hypothetical protein
MAQEIKIDFISEGFRAILTSGEVRGLVSSTAQDIASRAGEGFEVDTILGNYGGGRWISVVSARTREANAEQSENHVLNNALR